MLLLLFFPFSFGVSEKDELTFGVEHEFKRFVVVAISIISAGKPVKISYIM